ncbi:MAG: hypothetical protein Q9220_006142 [cf. Caloplaca sp. 1 TL-2023]
MDLPTPESFSEASPSTTLSALFLSLIALTDLTACSLPEEIGSYFWSSQAPIRCTFFFALTGYAYAFKAGGPLRKPRSEQASGWENLNNSVIFTWGFLEMLCWFWVFITLRGEKRELAIRKAEKKRAEEDSL